MNRNPVRNTVAICGLLILAMAAPAAAYLTDDLLVQSPDCLKESLRNVNTNINDNEYTRVKWETRNCKGTLEIQGTARIAGDLSGFASISRGGKVTIESQDRDDKRKLTLTPSNERFAYAYEVNGDRKTWDSEGQAWLSSVITLLVRRAGFGAEERVDYLLREKGVAGVLDEVTLNTSDHTKRLYLSLLLDKTTLNGSAVRSVIELAGRQIDSDHELARVLMSVTRRYSLTNESRAAYLKAVTALQSDYERRRALSAVLAKGSLSTDDVVAVLAAASTMDSDHERGQVLKQVSADSDFGQPRLQEAFVKAATEMDSDYELRQVLMGLLQRQRLAPSALDVVLTAAGSLDSDYERALLLTQLLNTQSLNQAQRNRVIGLVEEMDSDHERGKVATLLIKQMNN